MSERLTACVVVIVRAWQGADAAVVGLYGVVVSSAPVDVDQAINILKFLPSLHCNDSGDVVLSTGFPSAGV